MNQAISDAQRKRAVQIVAIIAVIYIFPVLVTHLARIPLFHSFGLASPEDAMARIDLYLGRIGDASALAATCLLLLEIFGPADRAKT
jgi:hypothetical protein